jgi:phage host-nuclease inhibitor protein Gam
MTTTRKTNRKAPPATRAEAENLLGQFRVLVLQETKITTDREAAIAEIDSRVGPELEKIKGQLTEITKELQRWALANPQAFGEAKSLDMQHGVIGWRTNPPKVNLPKTEDAILLDLVEQHLGTQFLRCNWEVDKESLITDRANLDPAALQKTGITITQTETFFVKPTLPDHATKQTITTPAE